MSRNDLFSMPSGSCPHGHLKKACTKPGFIDITASSKDKEQDINRAQELVDQKCLRKNINLDNYKVVTITIKKLFLKFILIVSDMET